MSTNCTDFDGFLSPTSKRFRAEVETPSECSQSQEPISRFVGHLAMSNDDSSPVKGGQVDSDSDYAVCSESLTSGSAKRRRTLGSPQYATAAVTSLMDNDTRHSNGDSGFQELNSTEEITLEMNGNEPIVDREPSIIAVNENTNINQVDFLQEDLNADDDNVSEISGVSDLSDFSDESWKPISNNLEWIKDQMQRGADPKQLLHQITGETMPDSMEEHTAWHVVLRLLSEPDKRSKLENVNTLDDVVSLIQKSKKIIVLTGAGVSVSCGIPDFRSRNGVYARLSQDYPDLPDPQAMFDITYFRRNPYPFFKFAKEIYPGQFAPSPSHNFIKAIENNGKLLRNYTQNIDTLEKAAGIENVITCHGSFATATCVLCSYKCPCEGIQEEIFAQKIPLCPNCSQSNTENSIMPVMKPDIVFFGEGLPREFHNSMNNDKDECDLLIVMGSSLKVRPVALIPNAVPAHVPQILINREPLSHLNFDVELLGDCDEIIKTLCSKLGSDWAQTCFGGIDSQNNIETETSANNVEFISPSRYIFQGAELNSRDSDDDSDDADDDSSIDGDGSVDEESDNTNQQFQPETSSNDLESITPTTAPVAGNIDNNVQEVTQIFSKPSAGYFATEAIITQEQNIMEEASQGRVSSPSSFSLE